jgi:hypothetical protein
METIKKTKCDLLKKIYSVYGFEVYMVIAVYLQCTLRNFDAHLATFLYRYEGQSVNRSQIEVKHNRFPM